MLTNADNSIQGIKPMVLILYIFLLVFAFFFISYVVVAYNKSRSKEFGIYLSLGMQKKHIYKFILVENTIVMIISSIVGICISIIITTLINTIIKSNEYFEKISLDYNNSNIILTICILLVIFLFTNFITIWKIKKSDIKLIISYEKTGKAIKGKHCYFTIGILIYIVLYIVGFLIRMNYIQFKFNTIIIFVFFLLSCYILISNTHYLFSQKARRNLDYYYKNILHLMDINYMFNQYKKVLYLISITSGMALFISGLILGAVPSDLRNNDKNNPDDFVIIKKYDDDIFDYNKLKLDIKYEFDYLTDKKQNYFYMSNESINKILNTNMKLKNNEAIGYGYVNKNNGDVITLYLNDGNIKKYVIKDVIPKVITNEFDSGFGLSKKEYESLEQSMDRYKVIVLKSNFNMNIVQEYIKTNNIDVTLLSKEHSRKNQIKTLTGYGFLILILSLTLFIASGTVLYFKIFIDVNKNKEKFRKLKLLRITKEDIKKTVNKELAIIFGSVYLFGGLSSYIWLIIWFVHNPYFNLCIIGPSVLLCMFTVSLLLFYKITSKKMLNNIIQ
jgi:putative ABC transport system permease protein